MPQQRESTEYWSRNALTVVTGTARVFYVVSAFFYFHPQYPGRRPLRFYVICAPRGAHLLMLQGREINLLFLSPAPGIEPGSAGVQLKCFTHRPRRPTIHGNRVCQTSPNLNEAKVSEMAGQIDLFFVTRFLAKV